MSTDAEENEWIADFLVMYLRSPPWTVPLNSFIDQHCISFDADDENKFVYSDIHRDFVKMIDDLLSDACTDLGLSHQEFASAVENMMASGDKDIQRLVLGQILAADDFLTFKKLMVKRNVELEMEVLRALENPTSTDGGDGGETGDEDEDERNLQLALQMSTEAAEAVKYGDISEHDLKAALAASVSDYDHIKAQISNEQAEIEQAIALSLALEGDQLKKLEAAQDDEDRALTDADKANNKEDREVAEDKAAKARQTQIKLTKELAPLRMPGGGGLTKLPKLADLQKQHRINQAKAENVFRETAQVVKEKKEDDTTAMQRKGGVSEAELKRRQDLLRAQRDLILAKKNKSRQKELDEFKKETEQNVDKASSASSSDEAKGQSEENAKRTAMRATLAQHFKADAVRFKKRKAAERANTNSLNDQLNKAEDLRNEYSNLSQRKMLDQEEIRRNKLASFNDKVQDGVM